MMTFTHPPSICPRCSGLLYPDYDGDLSCIACGEVLYCTPAVEPFRLPPACTPKQQHTRDYNREYQRRRRSRRQRSA
jgi:hypothetical protein